MTDLVENVPVPPVTPRRKTSFAGDVLKLVSGTTIAQALGILITPILTRLYAPEAFGTLALFTSITSILGVIACMRYELAIMLPESDEEAANLLGVSLGFTVLLSLLTIPVVWWGRAPLLNLLNAQELAPYLWLVPPMVLAAGIFHALNYWNSRTKRFGRLSIARVLQAGSVHSIKLGAGLAGYTTGGTLIGANVIGQAIATLILATQIWRDDANFFLRSLKWREMLLGLKRHRKFPLYDTWAALLNNVSWQLPAFFLSIFFSPTIVGYYALGTRLLRIPMSLIGASIAQVFFQRASEAKSDNTLSLVTESTFRRLVMLTLFPLLLLTIMGSDLFVIFLGENWTEAGVYTQILSLWMFFWFISSPFSTLFRVLERQEFSLFINVAIFITRFVALLIGGMLQNARLAIVLFSASGVLVYGYLSLTIMAEAGVAWSTMFKVIFNHILYSIPAGLILLGLKVISASSWIVIIVTAVLLIVYLIYVLWNDLQLRSVITDKIANSTFIEAIGFVRKNDR